jgi:hypothetical protein
MIRHFENMPGGLIEEVLSKGFNQKQVKESMQMVGSRFFSSFANDIPSLLEHVFAYGFDTSIGVNGNIVLKGTVPKVAFPAGIGTLGVVPKASIPDSSQKDIYLSTTRYTRLLHLKVPSLPTTNNFVIILKKTTNHFLFITGFPGTTSMPLPSASMKPALLQECKAFWDQQVFLHKSEVD